MKISQTEARRYRAEANKLREQVRRMHRTWADEYPDGACIGNLIVDGATMAKIATAGALKHAVMVTHYGDRILFHALPAPQPGEG